MEEARRLTVVEGGRSYINAVATRLSALRKEAREFNKGKSNKVITDNLRMYYPTLTSADTVTPPFKLLDHPHYKCLGPALPPPAASPASSLLGSLSNALTSAVFGSSSSAGK